MFKKLYKKNINKRFVNITSFNIKNQLFIDGEFRTSKSGKLFPVINPVDETVLTHVSEADKEDVDIAVQAAQKALNGEWKTIGHAGRQNLLLKLADLWDLNSVLLGQLESYNNGTPISQQKNVVADLAQEIRYHAGWCTKALDGRVANVSGNFDVKVIREPIGVVGAILPWNLPLWCLIVKLAPCLACGNTIVIKPAEQTPLTALKVAEMIQEAGFPKGVVNILPGYGPTAGSHLASHMDVRKIAFTGSGEVGKMIMKYASNNLKMVQLELGGKSPLIVTEDADIDKAVEIAATSIFSNNGEQCDAGSRTFVPESMYDEFVKRAVEKANSLIVGDPLDPKTEVGPLVDKAQFQKVLEYIDIGQKEGAKLHCGGRVGNKGYFVRPSVFSNVKDDMRIAKEEIFGPVQSILKYKTFEEALERVNNTPYGLASGIVTKDMTKAYQFSKNIKSGFVWVNTWFQMFPEVEFGGYKQSGFGKDGGAGSINEWTVSKAIVMNMNK